MNLSQIIILKKKFLKYLKNVKLVSTNTQISYNLDLEQLIKFITINKRKSSDSVIDVIQQFSFHIISSNIKKTSMARKMSCLNSFKKFLIKSKLNLKLTLTRPYYSQKNPETLPEKTINSLLNALEKNKIPSKFPYRDKAIIELIYNTGIKCSELVSIELKDIDIKNKTINIRNKYLQRKLNITTKTFSCIKKYLENERTKVKNLQEKLFLNYKNNPLTTRSVQRIFTMFRKFLEKTNLKLTPNIIRNSFASHAIDKGTDLKIVQKMLGHKTLISTTRYIKKQK